MVFDKKKISVILTTFNRKELLCRAIDSVQAQTRPADEIIVVDDGSTDGTAEAIKEKYPGIQMLVQKNSGVSAARNRAIEECTGDWIAILDSDDEWLPQKLARQMEETEKHPDYRICHSDEIWIRRGNRVNPRKKHRKRGGHIFRYCLPLCIISPSAVIIHRSVFDEFGLFDPALPACEDYDLWLRICAFLPVLFIPEQLTIKYGGHKGQLSLKHWGMDRFRIRALEKIIAVNRLDAVNRRYALEMLIKKLGIFLTGVYKRGRPTDAAVYEAKLAGYRKMLD